MPNDPAGAKWRKWDLHVHTPASFQWKGAGALQDMEQVQRDAAIQAVIESMNASEAAVFGVMDYWTFDGFLAIRDFLRRHQEVRLERTVLPGMELRCEAPADYRLNIHVLLSDQLTDQELWDFRARLKLTPGDRPLSDEALESVHGALTPDKLNAVAGDHEERARTPAGRRALGAQIALVQRRDIYEALKTVPGKGVLIVPWETYGGLQGIDWERHPAVVTDFMNHADLYETRKGAMVDLFQGRRTQFNAAFFENFIRSIGQARGVVSGSDAHRVADYGVFPAAGREGERATWIKADPTFEGLRQMLCEPSYRAFIGAEPPAIARVRTNPTKYMRSVKVRKRQGSNLAESWFDAEIPLNPGLVAIIGNKGSGKSALADVIGLLGNSSRHSSFSFLCKSKFCDPKENKAAHFDGRLSWSDGTNIERSLAAMSDPSAAERVRYVPQQYLEKICNEVDPGPGSAFDRELKAVIFSHVPEPERLGTVTLDDLLELRRKEAGEAVRALRDELRRINAEIVRVEDLLAPRERLALKGRLDVRLAELTAHEAARPPEVPKPDADPATQADLEAASLVLDGLRAQVKEAADRFETARVAAKSLSVRLAAVQRTAGQIDAFERDVKGVLERIGAEIPDDADFGPTDLVSVTVNRAPLDAYRSRTERGLEEAKAEIDPGKDGSAAALRVAADVAVAEHLRKMHGPALRYEEFREATARWEAARAAILGDATQSESVAGLRRQLADLDALPERLRELVASRRAKADEVHRAILGLAGVFRDLYAPVQAFAARHPLIADKFKLTFEVVLTPGGFRDTFLGMVSQGVTGSFYGAEDGRRQADTLLAMRDWWEEGAGGAFADDVVCRLSADFRHEARPPVGIDSQLRKGFNRAGLYDFLYGLEYLQPRYALQLDGKDLSRLSPGERGTLLLVFYLLVDLEDIPLVIDQPEENLDNQTVFRLVGACLREARHRRQVVVVTHNPNIAVACDADQVIVANHAASGDRSVSYATGAIENPAINAALLDVLEGTRPAFDNRDGKYRR